MVGPLRHRQTKEAETDMFNLPPPRHISTLPTATGSRIVALLDDVAHMSADRDYPRSGRTMLRCFLALVLTYLAEAIK